MSREIEVVAIVMTITEGDRRSEASSVSIPGLTETPPMAVKWSDTTPSVSSAVAPYLRAIVFSPLSATA